MQNIYLIGNSLVRIFVKNQIIQIVVAIVIILLLYTCGNTHKQPNLQSEEETKDGGIIDKTRKAAEERMKPL